MRPMTTLVVVSLLGLAAPVRGEGPPRCDFRPAPERDRAAWTARPRSAIDTLVVLMHAAGRPLRQTHRRDSAASTS